MVAVAFPAGISATTTTVEEATRTIAASIFTVTISCVLGSLYGAAIGSCDVAGLGSFDSFDDVELDLLAVSQTSQELLRIIIGDGGLMDEDVFIGIVAIDKAVAVLHIEPFDLAGDSASQYRLLWLLCLGLGGFLIFL